MDAYSLLAALETARETRGSGFPISWQEVADEIGVHSSAFSRLKQGRLPGPKTLRAVMEWLEIGENEFAVAGDTSLPIGPRDDKWDGEAATNRVFDYATNESGELDMTKLRRAFFFIDPTKDPKTRQAYKLPFCDVRGGALEIAPRGMSAVSGGHGVDSITGATASEKEAIKRKICVVYKRITEKYEDWPDCPFKPDGNRPERKERRNDKDAEGDPMTTATQTEEETEENTKPKTAGIVGYGSLSQSEDPDTQAQVTRVQELLREGAVAVSIKHDLHPEVSAKLAELEGPFENEEDSIEAMKQAQEIYDTADIRPRHVAVVDTAAFSNARLTLGEDGFSVSGPVTFEGIYTGDVRTLKYGSLQWDDDLLPIPITLGHEGPGGTQPLVIGYVDRLERVDGMTTAVRPVTPDEEDVEAVTAAAGQKGLNPTYFADFKPRAATPLTVTEEDEYGLRRVYGHVAPYGVCHRSDMGACFQYPRDVDKQHKGFHTGQIVTLSDGTTVRVGALTLGGKHLDASLARQGVSYQDANNHRDNANTVFAMVRAWEDAYGLAVSGVVMPDVEEADLFRAAASSPSVELWPAGRGRTLVGIHLVPTPAWPVAASAGGDAQNLTEQTGVVVIDPDGGYCAECEGEEHVASEEPLDFDARISAIESSLKRIEGAVALLAADALTDVPLPENTED